MQHWAKLEIRINLGDVLAERLERAVAYGWRRAHKHIDNPDPDTIQQLILEAVQSELYELLSWGDE